MKVSEQEWQEILRQVRNNEKKELDLSFKEIFKERIQDLAKVLRKNTSLTYLNLERKGIKDKAILLADALRENNSLTSLNLTDNKIGNEGAEWLAKALMENKTLTFLYLKDNDIGKRGADWLAEALKENSSLTFLDLRLNHIKSKGTNSLAKALIENKSLTSLGLNFNDIGEVGKRLLAKALKKNKCLQDYHGDIYELRDLAGKNKADNTKLAIRIDIKFNSYLEALLGDESIDISSNLSLIKVLKQCAAAINFMLQTGDIGAAPETVVFFNIAFKTLQNSEESYNSTSELFEAAMTELAMKLSEGYYEHARDYPVFYIQHQLFRKKPYKISDEVKEKLLSIPSVSLYNMAIEASEQGNHEEALKNLEQAQVKAPGEPRIMLEKVKVLYSLGWLQQADEEFSGALGTDITTSDKFIEVRDWFEKQGEFDKAITLQEKIIRDTGDNSGLAKLALLKFENHSPDEALETLDKLVEHEPEEFSAYHLKAKFHYILADGGFDELIKAGEEKAKPKPAEYYKLGDWLDKHADTSRAYEYNIKADKLSDQAFLAEIYANWFKQHSDFQKDISALHEEVNYLRSDSIKHAKELDEFEEVIDIREEEDIQVLGDYS